MISDLVPLQEKHVTLVAFGDSNTQNNHWTGYQRNWVQLLEGNFYNSFRKGYTVINSGVSGDTVAGGLRRLDRDVLRFQPDIVIVGFGINDAMVSNPEAFKQDYASLLKTLKEKGIFAICRTPTPVIDMLNGTELRQWEQNGRLYSADNGLFSEIIRNLAEKYQFTCIDHYSSWTDSMKTLYHGEIVLLMGNPIHPNGMGHRRLYSEIAPFFGLPVYFQQDYEHLLQTEKKWFFDEN